jgi:hypothetical protein
MRVNTVVGEWSYCDRIAAAFIIVR